MPILYTCTIGLSTEYPHSVEWLLVYNTDYHNIDMDTIFSKEVSK